MSSRKQEEALFHDRLREEASFTRYSPEAEESTADKPQWRNFMFYSIERESRNYVEAWISRHGVGKRLLDYGCGNGETAIFAARSGAYAVGIDISETSVRNCEEQAAAAGLAQRSEFRVMDAEKMEFADDSFDLIVVYGVLHHLDFRAAMSEIARTLRPAGRAICTEALGHNPLIAAYRRRTPDLRTAWEVDHIMKRRNIVEARRWFEEVTFRTYHLTTIAAVPFRKTRAFPLLLRALEVIDRPLLSLPGIRWMGWQVVFELAKPRRNPSRASLADERLGATA